MKKQIRNSIATLGSLLPYSWLCSGNDFPPFLPFYHVVSDTTLDYVNSYKVRTQVEFEKELDYLLARYKAVTLEEIIRSPSSTKMHLTFDDGMKECASIIAPVLKRKGVPATFFISPDFIGNKAIFHRFKQSILENKGVLETGGKKYFFHESGELDELAKANFIDYSGYNPYLSVHEVEGLKSNGFTIGAHSLNHPEMWLLGEEEQFRQIAESIQWVVDRFQPSIRAFSFPFTDNDLKSSLFERLKKENIVDFTFGTAGLKFDSVSTNLQRIPVEAVHNWSIKKVVHFEYFYFKIRHLFSANTIRRD